MDPSLASSITGYLSILCWLIVFTPQLWENYRRKSGDGLSMTFLVIWLAGDVFNLLGVIMQDLLVTMFFLALYYTVADMGLIWQVIYYQHKKLPSDDEESVSERSSLLNSYVHKKKEQVQSSKYHTLFNWISALSIVLVTIVSCYTYYNVHQTHDTSGITWLPQLMGWLSALLYVGSRIPQLVKNYKNQSTEGLSIGMFLCAVMGNIFYTASIFLKSTDVDYIWKNMSWIVGSVGTLLFDFLVK
ncbi:PQ-loop-domain-containing protein [Rhizopus microsporus var. microsporus]|uniref:PQ-loop-domain-containing protein n=2 Tax=Rhizopus microsporus TaxID=58291 RepID=A0A2G4T800_RHIZD|nr:PQ-loop-domain-containing protein [Rhizopus microsporus ATCC 52813]ORE06071.1 PQ-loop-domain-containing protein [Rhizopus microsporus var. microsporus]PHZ17138.1 PQ-loop-domain-containing protein [Rhizopus microsporus ATCC 52813]